MNDKRERIGRALQIAAKIVSSEGAVYLPIFERLEREYSQLSAADAALERARRMAGDL